MSVDHHANLKIYQINTAAQYLLNMIFMVTIQNIFQSTFGMKRKNDKSKAQNCWPKLFYSVGSRKADMPPTAKAKIPHLA